MRADPRKRSDTIPKKFADQFAQHVMPPRNLVFLTHYFVTRWLPKLGHGQGWFVVLIRDRCYLNPRTGEIRDTAVMDNGYLEIANCLGLKRVENHLGMAAQR